MEAVGEREKVVVMVMGKMRDTGRMVVKDSKMGGEGGGRAAEEDDRGPPRDGDAA